MIRKNWLRTASAVAAMAFVLAACGDDGDNGEDNGDNGDSTEEETDDEGSDSEDESAGDEEPAADDEELSGNVLVDGSSTVAPASEAAAELFMTENGGVQVDVGTSGTGGGFERFCVGETDLSDASRPISDEEIAVCEDNSIAYEQITVANDALSVVVNPENPVDCLTVDQLAAIWEPDSSISSWGDIPDLEADFDEALDLYGPGPDSGTFDYFTGAVVGEEGAIRTDYNNIGENDESGVLGVEGSVGGMFFVGYSYYAENEDSLKALAIDNGDGCVEPTPETAADGSYTPLTRGLFVYASDVALERPEVGAFLQFYIDNNEEITTAADVIGISEDQATEARSQLDALMGG